MKKYLQLKGQTFGMLTITHIFNSQKCKAKCECGTEKEYKLGNIKYGRTKSCGCNRYVTGKPKPRKADKRKFSKPVLPEGTGSRKVKILTGIRFGKLMVLAPNVERKGYWDAACDCGSKVTVFGGSLRSGNTKSCGCLRNVNIGRPMVNEPPRLVNDQTFGMENTDALSKIYESLLALDVDFDKVGKEWCIVVKGVRYGAYRSRLSALVNAVDKVTGRKL